MTALMTTSRDQWSGRVGFILAATGSAVGLGSIWKFPFIAGMNGGGNFILAYLACVVVVALPVLIAEILLGRHAGQSTVVALRKVGQGRAGWLVIGWIGILGSALILSYYSVVGGWTLHYVYLSVTEQVTAPTGLSAQALYQHMVESPGVGLFWHLTFMGASMAVVAGGVSTGLERANRILMPTLLLIMLVLLSQTVSLPGFRAALEFAFMPRPDEISTRTVLEALGHSFFSLSVGLGAMLTYGSYLSVRDDIPGAAVAIAVLDTLISLLACLIVFPILFTYGLKPEAGPGLLFLSLPIAFAQMPGGAAWSAIFFALLSMAALSSAISMLEVVTAHLTEAGGRSRRSAVCWSGGAIALLGLPAVWSGSVWMFSEGFGQLMHWIGLPALDWMRAADWFASNVLLPLGGFGLSALVAWGMSDRSRREEYATGSALGGTYRAWLFSLRFVAIPAIVFIGIQWMLGR